MTKIFKRVVGESAWWTQGTEGSIPDIIYKQAYGFLCFYFYLDDNFAIFCSFGKYLLSTYYVPTSVQCAGNRASKKAKPLLTWCS